MIEFTIPGQPTGKARPKVTRFGNFNTEKTVFYENLVKTCYNGPKLNGYIEMTIICYYQMPSGSKKKRQNMIDGVIRPAVKPDLDNVAKIVCDALNGLAYDDDKQVVSLSVAKWYNETPRVVVRLEEVV